MSELMRMFMEAMWDLLTGNIVLGLDRPSPGRQRLIIITVIQQGRDEEDREGEGVYSDCYGVATMLYVIDKIVMSEVDDYVRMLRRWREQDNRSVLSILQRITQTKSFAGQELEDIARAVVDFHKEIGKASESEVDPKWFELSINLKKKLKKMQESQKVNEKPKLEKKPSVVVEFPEALLNGRGPNEQQMLKSIYKNFITNFQEAVRDSSTVSFVHSTLKELKYLFEEKTEEALHKRINSICLRLARENSKEAKEKMLGGAITPKELAHDDEELYFDEKTRENIKKNQLAQLEESQTGFYDEMKKKINKDACEECRFCRKKNAFCEDMKQIRASDEPMTRFMRCNACGKAWRD